jgi:dihydropteroate synthase
MHARSLPLDRPLVVAILNVTPDSFSDGGRFQSIDQALRRAEEALEEGADMLDIGGESTRPGAARIEVDEERRRVLPVLDAVRRRLDAVPISIDTTRSQVADAALSAGADAVNDVSGLRLDERLAAVVASHGAGLVIMHSRGGVEDMAGYAHAVYGTDIVADVVEELRQATERATRAGVDGAAIVVDPGIGFAKRPSQSLMVLGQLDRLAALGFPVMVGASRKRFIGDVTGVGEPSRRGEGSIGAHVMALARGAKLFRVHDVRAHRHALDVASAILSARAGGA